MTYNMLLCLLVTCAITCAIKQLQDSQHNHEKRQHELSTKLAAIEEKYNGAFIPLFYSSLFSHSTQLRFSLRVVPYLQECVFSNASLCCLDLKRLCGPSPHGVFVYS